MSFPHVETENLPIERWRQAKALFSAARSRMGKDVAGVITREFTLLAYSSYRSVRMSTQPNRKLKVRRITFE